MKKRLIEILKCGLITAFCFSTIVLTFKFFYIKETMKFYLEVDREEIREQLKDYGEMVEMSGQDYKGEKKLEEEGSKLLGIVYGTQIQLIGEVFISIIIGLIIGIGIGYIKTIENISKSSIKNLGVMYLTGFIMILLFVNIYESILGFGLKGNDNQEDMQIKNNETIITEDGEEQEIVLLEDDDGEICMVDLEKNVLLIIGYTVIYFTALILKIRNDNAKKVKLNKLLKENDTK